MVMKKSHPLISNIASGLRPILIGSSLAILAASAMSGSAYAKEIVADPGIQTLGGNSGANLPVGTVLSSSFSRFSFLGTEGNEPDDKTTEQSLNETQPVGNADPGENQGEGLTTQAGEVPEPGILGLFGAGLVALGLFRRRLG